MGRDSYSHLYGYGFIALAVLVLVGFLWVDGRLDAQQNDTLRSEIESIASKTELSYRRIDSLQAELADLNLRVRDLESGLEASGISADDQTTSTPPIEPIGADQSVDQSAEARAALQDRLEQAQETADTAAERATTLFGTLDTDSEAFQHMSEVQANAQVDMVYADMFEELGLSPDRAAAVRQVLIDSTLDEMRSGIEFMRDGNTRDAVAQTAARDAREEQLRADLQSLLTPEEYTRWEQYADTKPARMLASSYDMQLNSLAPGLSLENRQLARDVLVEETLLLQTDGADPFAGFADPATSIQTQAQILENAANRLATVFDPQQMERFQAFADYQLSLMESATRLIQ